MKLKRIILENCIGLVKGSDIDKLEINFEDVESSIIGIFGKVGSGKSTLLNNINPYRANFTNDFYEDGYKEIEFEFKGNNYLSKIYQDKASLFKNEILLNQNGKVSTYDEELEAEIGDEKVFMKLLYAGKRFKNILNLTKGERKELIVDYLLEYLKHYDSYQIKLKNDMEELVDKIRVCEIKSEEYDFYLKTHSENIQLLDNEKNNYDNIENEILDLQKEQELFLLQQEQNKDIKLKLETIDIDIRKKEKEKSESESEYKIKEKKISDLRLKYNDLKEKIEKANDELYFNEDIVDIKIEIENLKESCEEDDEEKITNGKEIVEYKSDIKNKKEKIEELKIKIQNLKLPCTSDLQQQCPLADYKDVKKINEASKKEIENLESSINKLNDLIDNKLSRQEYLSDNIKKLKKIISDKELIIEKNQEHKVILSQKTLLDEYKIQGKELKTDLDSLHKKILQMENDIDVMKTQMNEYIDIYNANNKYENKENTIIEYQNKLNESNAEKTYLSKIIYDATKKILELEEYKENHETYQNELAEYDLLIEFFGKTGGQIFDIEQAGNEISKITNQLLEHYTDKKLIVKFDTLKQNKKGEFKEVFDISVSINDGDWQTYLSDGESVLVSNAIREAMCYLRQSKDFKTVFIDELDGSIDTDNIIGFIKLLEEGNKLNERQFTFLISHNEEVKSYLEKSITFKPENLILNL